MPHTNRIFVAPATGREFVLLRDGSERRLLSRDDALRLVYEQPDGFRWHTPQKIRVRFADGHVRMVLAMRAEKIQKENSIETVAPRRVRISIPRPVRPRPHNVGGRGKLMRGGDPRRTNVIDDLVEAGCGRDPILWNEFERAWGRGSTRHVTKEA